MRSRHNLLTCATRLRPYQSVTTFPSILRKTSKSRASKASKWIFRFCRVLEILSRRSRKIQPPFLAYYNRARVFVRRGHESKRFRSVSGNGTSHANHHAFHPSNFMCNSHSRPRIFAPCRGAVRTYQGPAYQNGSLVCLSSVAVFPDPDCHRGPNPPATDLTKPITPLKPSEMEDGGLRRDVAFSRGWRPCGRHTRDFCDSLHT